MTDVNRDRSCGSERELGFADLVVSSPTRSATPVHRDPCNRVSAPSSLAKGKCPSTVLVIEDDQAIRLVVRRMLEVEGYQVVEAAGGRTALSELRSGVPIDIVMTDLKMEDGSGGWLLAQIGYEYPHLLTRTVVMSGDPAGAGAAHIATRWHCPVLAKPFGREALIGAVARLVHNGGGGDVETG